MPASDLSIRLATVADLVAINDIYNYYVHHSTCTYQTESETMEDRKEWFHHHGPKHPVTAVQRGGEIVGWGSLSPFHPRAAYANTVENSVYVRHDLLRQGIGGAVLDDLLARARQIGHHTIVAGIDGEQAASVALHSSRGFAAVAHLKEVGHKFGRWLDVVYMQLILCDSGRHA